MSAPVVRKLIFSVDGLRDYMLRVMRKAGARQEDAVIVADVLLSADMRGVESHGIIRLFPYYAHRLARGLVNAQAELKPIRETFASAAFDGDNGLGHPTSYRAMQRCIEKAQEVGAALVTVCNSNHYGIAGYYAMMALPRDMIGLSFTNAGSLVTPTHGRTRVLGTNPIAVAAPGGQEWPYVLDMATSIVPVGRITVYEKAGLEIPYGWGINERGEVTTHPDEIVNGGALLPLGGTELMRGYKGYGLALMVEILCGILSGADFGTRVDREDRNASKIGHCFAALRIDAFRPLAEFRQDMDGLFRQLKESPKAAGQDRIYIHGEKEFERAARSLQEGVPIMASVVSDLEKDGREFGAPFDLEAVGEIEEVEG